MFTEPITIRLDVVDSTNNYAANLLKQTKVPEFSLIVTKRQEKGKGQRGTQWQSAPGKNFTGTFVVYPQMRPQDFYLLQKATAVAVLDTIKTILPRKKVEIKWPNDIYVEGQKIGGILLESQLRKDHFEYVLLGIGINVNQVDFEGVDNATSVVNQLGKEVAIDELETLLQKNITRYMRPVNTQKIDAVYTDKLYGRNRKMRFQLPDGSDFLGIIRGVTSTGLLDVELNPQEKRKFDIKEIIFTHEFPEGDSPYS